MAWVLRRIRPITAGRESSYSSPSSLRILKEGYYSIQPNKWWGVVNVYENVGIPLRGSDRYEARSDRDYGYKEMVE